MKKVVCVLIFIASVLLFSYVPVYAKEKDANVKETENVAEITVKEAGKKIKFTSVNCESPIEYCYSAASGNGCYMALVNSDMGEEAYFGSKDGSFKRVDLAGLVKENFGLTEDDEISIDDVMYADKKFLVSGTYYEKTEEDVPKYKEIFVVSTKNCEKFNFYHIGGAEYYPYTMFKDEGLTYSIGFTYLQKVNGTFYVCLNTHIQTLYPDGDEKPESYDYDIDCITGYYGTSLKKMKPVRLKESIKTELKDLSSVGMTCEYNFKENKVIQGLNIYPNMETVGESYISKTTNGKKWSKLEKTDEPIYEFNIYTASVIVEWPRNGQNRQKVTSISGKGIRGFEAVLPTDELLSSCVFLLKEDEEKGLYYGGMLAAVENDIYRVNSDSSVEKVKIPFTIEEGVNNFACINDMSLFTADGYLYMTKTDFDGLVRIPLPCSEEEFVDIDGMGNYLVIISNDRIYRVKGSKLAACFK